MREPFNRRHLPRSSWFSGTLLLGSLVLIITVLYLARTILIPIALAILLTFILAPIVTGLRRHGLNRTLAVLTTVVLTFVLIGAIGTMLFVEIKALAEELPSYRQNIRQRIADFRFVSKGTTLSQMQETVKEVIKEMKQDEDAEPVVGVPVVVTREQESETSGMDLLGALLEPLVSTGLVIVLVIFMLLRREELRDRLFRLAGYGRLAATTKAIDDAGRGVSRYLLRQFLANSAFGLAVGLGLLLIGLPYPLLWGVLAGVARFIPYLGPWIGALGPCLLSLAVFDGWGPPLLVIGLVIGLELIHNLVVEPLLYGQSIGVSEVALLVMIVFWSWLWGPIGLVLAAPLTVCLMVISKSVPDLEFISLLLSSEPALSPHHALYQRLIAHHHDDAQDIVETFLKDHSHADMFEQLLIPTLIASRHDHLRERLSEDDRDRVWGVIRQLIEETDEASPAKTGNRVAEPAQPSEQPAAEPRLMLGCPANDEADELALLMLADLLGAERYPARVLSSQLLSTETLAEVARIRPAVVCVGVLPESSLFPLRPFCKRLRSRFPDIPIVVGRWGARDLERTRRLLAGSVSDVGSTLAESKNQVIQFGQTRPVSALPKVSPAA